MPGHPFDAQELMSYLDGELPVQKAQAAREHLIQCAECQQLARDLGEVSRRMTAWEVEAGPAEILPALREALIAAPASEVRHWRGLKRAYWLIPAVAASCVFAAFTVRLVQRTTTGYGDIVANPKLQTTSYMVAPPRPEAEPAPGNLIVKTAQLSLICRSLDGARREADRIIASHRGYFERLSIDTVPGDTPKLDSTVRIPANELDAAIEEVKRIGRVSSESRGAEDVSREHIDLDARLATARVTEQRLMGLLRERTAKLSDVLAVEKEMGEVRSSIERMEAEKRTLDRRIEFATLHLMIYEEFQDRVRLASESAVTKLENAAVQGVRGMVNGALDVLGFALTITPSLLLWSGVLYLVWRGVRRFRNRKAS